MICKPSDVHRPELWCEQFGIAATDTKHDKRSDVPEYRSTDDVAQLSCEFPSAKCVSILRLSDKSEANTSELSVWNSSIWTQNGVLSCGGISLRSMAINCK